MPDNNGGAPSGSNSGAGSTGGPAPASGGSSGGSLHPTTISPPGADKAPSLPAGHRLVRDEDYSRFESRSKIAERAEALGFKDPNDFGRYEGLFKAVAGGQIDPDLLMRALAAKPSEPKGGRGGESEPVDVEAIIAERFRERDTEAALRDHDKARGGEGEYFNKALAELLGDDEVDDHEKELTRLAMLGAMHEARGKDSKAFMYPEGHALRTQRLAPFGPENTKAQIEALKELRKNFKGSILSGVGKAANRRGATGTTPAGAGGGTPDGRGKNKLGPGEHPVDAELKRMADAIRV